MVTVLIHPSRGNADGRVNLKRSLEKTVRFTDPEVASLLSQDQMNELLLRHPSGEARFWGTYEHNRSKILRVFEGDAVIFTGEGQAWAAGVVGYRFENEAFAQKVWQETEGKGTYRHIYSLANFETVDIPYPAINEPLGLRPGNHFQGMVVYDRDGKGDVLADALHLELGGDYLLADARLASALDTEVPVNSALRPIEPAFEGIIKLRPRSAGGVMRRGESMLVAAYAATLPDGITHGRHQLAAGVTDLWIDWGDQQELVEAKSVCDHEHVRHAMAQLLDYAPAMDNMPTIVTALFPSRPPIRSVSLLHRYGVDCLYRIGAGSYRREGATQLARTALIAMWA